MFSTIDYNVESNVMLIDSGASKSMFSSKHMFQRAMRSTTQTIRFGNGPCIPVEAVGSLVLPCPCDDGTSMHHLRISDCLYVPQQQFNILSVHHVKTLRHEVNLHEDTVTWNCESSSACTQRIHWIHNLPYLLSTSAMQAVIHVQPFQQSPSQRDHYHHGRLEHISMQNQTLLTKLDLVKSESTTKSHALACKPCIEGTAHKDSYPTLSTDERASHPNHTLSCDWLTMSQVDFKQRKFMLIVVDEYSRYAFAFLLRTKAEAKTKLRTRRANVLHPSHPVKYLHHDGGGELLNATMEVARDELGIEHAFIPPDCHQTNGIVERLNCTIARQVRTMLSDTKLPNYQWGECAMHAVHLYNLTPHSTLNRRGYKFPIPHSLYTGQHVTGLHRLYQQLLSSGHPWHVLDTRDHILKLEKLASPVTIVGVGDSTLFYKFLQYVPTPRISIVRHIHVAN